MAGVLDWCPVKIVTDPPGGVAKSYNMDVPAAVPRHAGHRMKAREVGMAVIVCAAIAVVVAVQHARPSSIVLEGDDDFSIGYVLGCALRAKERVGRLARCLLPSFVRTGVDWEPKPVPTHT